MMLADWMRIASPAGMVKAEIDAMSGPTP